MKSLLDLSRIEPAESKFDLLPVDLSQLVQEVNEQFASHAEETEHEFEAGATEEDVSVMGNPEQLRQVMITLFENALKFTPGKGLISVAFKAANGDPELAARDTCIGIPRQDLPQQSKRFHRRRNAATYAGNELGLAIVKAIVTPHQGEVTVQSEPGKGTQMIVSTPSYKGD